MMFGTRAIHAFCRDRKRAVFCSSDPAFLFLLNARDEIPNDRRDSLTGVPVRLHRYLARERFAGI
jgi:hypothetical protein